MDHLEQNALNEVREISRRLFWGDIIQAALGFVGFVAFVLLLAA